MSPAFGVFDEFAPLAHVVLGRAAGFHRDPSRVEIVNAMQDATVVERGHPTEAALIPEFGVFQEAMQNAGVVVHIPELADESVQDQTCPRDIGFVIGNTFVTAGMRWPSRTAEVNAISDILASFEGPLVEVPSGIALEGGDVIVDNDMIFVGIGQRTDAGAVAFLQTAFADQWQIVPLPTTQDKDGVEVLHLDCTFNPLGLGHALIYPDGLREIPAMLNNRYQLIEVARDEAAALATNVFSVAPDHVIARSNPACTRVNAVLRSKGYRVTELDFDGVPGIGGSFRCATLPLLRT